MNHSKCNCHLHCENNCKETKSIMFTKVKSQKPSLKKKRKVDFLTNENISHDTQQREIIMLFSNIDFQRNYVYKREIMKKGRSYIHQDLLKQRLRLKHSSATLTQDDIVNDDHELDIHSFYYRIVEKLVSSKLSCSYCQTPVLVLYPDVLQQNQWTLDRINNDLHHDIANCVISCLACNISKRRRSDSSFRFTKQMVIKKV